MWNKIHPAVLANRVSGRGSAAGALQKVNTPHTLYKRTQTNTDQGCNEGAFQPVEWS